MNHTSLSVIAAALISATGLSGCVENGAFYPYESRAPVVYRERVVVERREYYVKQPRHYRANDGQLRTLYPATDRRSPRCIGTNCYVGATYREDPYYR